jgi:hypothetical protein
VCDLNIQFQYNHRSVRYMNYCTYSLTVSVQIISSCWLIDCHLTTGWCFIVCACFWVHTSGHSDMCSDALWAVILAWSRHDSRCCHLLPVLFFHIKLATFLSHFILLCPAIFLLICIIYPCPFHKDTSSVFCSWL